MRSGVQTARHPLRFFGPLLLGVLFGTALQLQQSSLSGLWVYGALVLVALGVLVWLGLPPDNVAIPPRRVALGVVFLASSVLAFGLTGLRAQVYLHSALAPALEGQNIAVVGVVAGLTQRNDQGVRFRLDVESAERDGRPVRLPAKVQLVWYGGVVGRGDGAGEPRGELQRQPEALRAGQRWAFTVRLKAPHGTVNPFGFDYELWQWEQGVQAIGYVRAGPRDPAPRYVGTGHRYGIDSARQQVRERIVTRVADAKAAGWLSALVVGDQASIDRVDWNVFRATGVAHLMSISGLHITMFAWFASAVLRWVWRRSGRLCLCLPAPQAASVGGLGLAVAYALFSGWGVPAQRTVLMLGCVVGLRLLGLRWPWYRVWLLACAVVVLADPWALLQAGFWLSFVAVGVLFATDVRGPAPDAHRLAVYVKTMVREQWVITLALTPLCLLLFGQVSVVGLLANMLAIPWVTLVVTPLAMLGVLWGDVWVLAAMAVSALGAVLAWLAQWPLAMVSVAQTPWWFAAAGVAAGVLLVLRVPWRLRLCALPLVLPVLLWQPHLPSVGHFELLGADVGQGNAVLVRTAHHALLYDAGPRYSQDSDAGHRVLVPLLRALDTQLDTLVVSHRDADHSGGAGAVLAMQPQTHLLSSLEAGNPLQAGRSATPCMAGQSWQWDGVTFEVLHPSADDYATARRPNTLSCVLRVSNGVHTALLVGDIEVAQEQRLVAAQAPLRAEVLLVPHHGSQTSSSEVFLDAVAPRWALVQSGYRNRYGHPTSAVLARYAQRGILVLESPHCGAMTWSTEVSNAPSCRRQTHQRYWQHRAP